MLGKKIEPKAYLEPMTARESDECPNREFTTLVTCSILNHGAHSLTTDVQDRMPVILRPNDYDLWLDPGMTRTEEIVSMLRPVPAQSRRELGDKINWHGTCASSLATELMQVVTEYRFISYGR